jgi:hypothetical protein
MHTRTVSFVKFFNRSLNLLLAFGVTAICLLFATFTALNSWAQQTNAVVPHLVRFGGVLTDLAGKPLTGTVGVTFALYSDQQAGVPLWLEMQNVVPDLTGHYSVQLGSTKPDGIPTELFTSGEARWLGVQPEGQAEQPRVLLLSVPYALKAGDAETLGGLPPSAFVQANQAQPRTEGAAAGSAATRKAAAQSSVPPANPAVTGKGVVDFIPMWDTTSDILDSVMFQKSLQIGINTTSPAATLDVNGKSDIRDTLTLFPKSTDSTLAVNGTSFKVDSTGKVTFISGQTFPGAGTITGITTATGSGLSGGGTAGTLSLKVPSAGITNAMLTNSKITLNANTAGGITAPGAMSLGSTYTIGLKTCSANQILEYNGTVWNCSAAGTGTITGVTAGTDLTGGGTTGNVTLNLDTTKVPQLNTPNNFTQAMAVNTNNPFGSIQATGTGEAIVGIMTTNNFFTSAIAGSATASGAGTTIGVQGSSSTDSGYGVYGSGGPSGAGVYGSGINGVGVFGNSSSSIGVSGNSSTGFGVLGNSSASSGVYGISGGAGRGGVYGINTSSGFGVYALTTGSAGQGVWGESLGTGFANGAGSDGVHGVSHSTAGSGVAGVNDAKDATGVYGSDPQGYGFVTDSHVQQGRSAGGWVKAMAYVDFGGTIHRCFNSQISGSTASTVPCGITVNTISTGDVVVDFGFEIDDRFVQITFTANQGSNQFYGLSSDGYSITNTQVEAFDSSTFPSSFYVVVY